MTTHYRSLTSAELQGMMEELGCPEYEALASFGAVRVGASGDGQLPEETPWLELLQAGGVTTIAQALGMDLTTLPGIGDARAAQVLASLPAPAVLVHVAGPDEDGLPGTVLGGGLEVMDETTRAAICRARIIRMGDDHEELVPEDQVPEGAQVLETGLAPHAFA